METPPTNVFPLSPNICQATHFPTETVSSGGPQLPNLVNVPQPLTVFDFTPHLFIYCVYLWEGTHAKACM